MSKLSTSVVLTDEQFAADFDSSLLIKQPAADMTSQQADIIKSSATKSDKIRQLLSTGMTRGQVAKVLQIRYQHVRNVELTPLKKK